ncbi:MAG: hypothetical protein R2712_30570 [Vicinamibacterales bacterium]
MTRLHVRYDAARFPEDPCSVETGDRTNFQGRYVLRHKWTGPMRCAEAETYVRTLPERASARRRPRVSLTGWSIEEVRRHMGLARPPVADPGADASWWRRLWGRPW